MSLDASSYFDHLKAYIAAPYIVDAGSGSDITLTEKYYREGETRKTTRKVVLGFRGRAFAVKLDGRRDPLFHFLDDNGKPWSKRCDFVVLQCVRRTVNGYLFEFKTRSLEAQSIIDQLRSGVHWCACLRKVVQQYTGDSKPLRLRKFVFTENERPDPFLDADRKYLARDRSIRHYHYDELGDLTLDDLENSSVNTV